MKDKCNHDQNKFLNDNTCFGCIFDEAYLRLELYNTLEKLDIWEFTHIPPRIHATPPHPTP